MRQDLALSLGRRRSAPVSLLPGLPLARWSLVNVAGQSITDASGNGYALQLGSAAGADTNDPQLDAGEGNSLRFQVDDYLVNAALPAALSVSELTVMLAYKQRGTGGGFAFSAGTVLGSRLCAAMPWAGNIIDFDYPGPAPVGRLSYDAGAAVLTAWHSWAFVVSQQSALQAIYKDGNATPVATQVPVAAPASWSGSWQYGAFEGGYFDDANIAAALIYNRALAPAEIADAHSWLKTELAAAGITLP